MWYKKKTDPVALYIARQCGIEKEFECLGSVLHADDLEKVRKEFLGVSEDTIKQLFEKKELSGVLE